MYCLSSTDVCFSLPAHAAGASASPDTSCRRSTCFVAFGLPTASSRCLAKVRKRPLGLGTPLGSSLRLGHSCKPDGSRLLCRLCGQEPSNAARAEAACGLYLASARNRRRNRMPSCLHGRLRCQEEADRQHVGQRKQRSHREYDSPFLPPVGPGNCTFPGYQPLSYFGYKVRRWKKEFLNLRIKTSFRVSGRAGRLPLGRPAPLARSGRSPGRPTRMKNNRTILFISGRHPGDRTEFARVRIAPKEPPERRAGRGDHYTALNKVVHSHFTNYALR